MTNPLSGALEPDVPGFQFDLTVPTDARKSLAMAWLALGLLALLASGLFSVLLVLSRTPQLQTLFPVADFSVLPWWCMWICRYWCGFWLLVAPCGL